MIIPFDNSYARLPERFYVRQPPVPVRAPRLVALNEPLAHELGLDLDWLQSPAGLAMLAGNRLPENAASIAQAYAGHQFGGFSPQLGDGRALMIGEVIDSVGKRRDIQLKGAGQTPFSRRGDGRAALGPALREYLIGEAMFALGVPTTRALAVVATGEPVYREEALPGAVLTRVASSHIRVGTFQYFAARGDMEAVRLLMDHAMARHDPASMNAPNPALAFLAGVIARQAELVANWLALGFIHGVMNTDNMTISGETIDYGPCAFMDGYDPATVFSSIDRQGRYAYANQPVMAQWNLTRLAECLVPLIGPDEDKASELASAAIGDFGAAFNAAYMARMRAKTGLVSAEDGDIDLIRDLMRIMAAAREGRGADFTLTFRAMCDASLGPAHMGPLSAQFSDGAALEEWLKRWRARLAREATSPEMRLAAMRAANPVFIARNHRVEEALDAAYEGEMAPFATLAGILARPFDDQPEYEAYRQPAPASFGRYATFCGT
jgi:serine/tyrosine/threonine adenylyltransferase